MLTNWNIRIWEYEFLQPIWLILLLFIPIYYWFSFKSKNSSAGEIKFSGSMRTQRKVELKWVKKLRNVLSIFRVLAAVLLILALAKPLSW